jgi:hypothetical protein
MKGGEITMALFASDFDKSKYLRAEDLKSEKKFRIKAVTVEAVGNDKEQKLVVWFTNDERGLVLNKTNNRTLRGSFGDDTSTWPNRIIIVFPTMTDLRGKMTPALRVRTPPPKSATTATAAPKPAPSGNGAAAVAQPKPVATVEQQLDEFGQSQSAEKPSIADDLDDEVPFN